MASDRIIATVTEVMPDIGILKVNSLMYGEMQSPYSDSKRISNRLRVLSVGDLVQVEAEYTMNQVTQQKEYSGNIINLEKIEYRRIEQMKQKILNTIKELEAGRKECIDVLEKITNDENLSYEGKRNKMQECVDLFKAETYQLVNPVLAAIQAKIDNITEQEEKEYLRVRSSESYNTVLSSTLKLLELGAADMDDEDIKNAVSQFANDPLAIQAIKAILEKNGRFSGNDSLNSVFKTHALLPEDNRGGKQLHLDQAGKTLISIAKILSDIQFHESATSGSTSCNNAALSVNAVAMYDTDFIQSLNADCTGVIPEKKTEKEINPDFGFNFAHIAGR